jgi:hypothetical protein
MRHETLLIAGAALVLTATACDKASSITGPEAPYAKRADALTSQISGLDVPWDIPMVDPCNGDEVTITGGSTHFVFGGTYSDNTGGVHISMKVSSRGTGVGLPPNFFVYKVSDQFNESVQNPVGPQFTWLDEERFLILAEKSEDNYILHTVFKLTMNANGIPTVYFDRAFTECVG